MNENAIQNDILNILIEKKWNYERIFATISYKLNAIKKEQLVCIDSSLGIWFIKKHECWELINNEQTIDWILNDWIANYIKLNIHTENIDINEILNVLKFTSFVKESRQLFYNTSLPF